MCDLTIAQICIQKNKHKQLHAIETRTESARRLGGMMQNDAVQKWWMCETTESNNIAHANAVSQTIIILMNIEN